MLLKFKNTRIFYLISMMMIAAHASAQELDYGAEVLTPKVLAKQQGDKRPENQHSTSLFGRPLTIGGEVEFNPEVRRNLELLADNEDELVRLDQKLEIEAFYDAGRNVYVFAEAKLKRQNNFIRGEDDRRTSAVERGESWVFVHFPVSGFGLQIGRQAFKDKREWWWDADLDAIRLRYDRGKWRAEISLAQELAGVSSESPLDPEDKKVQRFIGNAQWRWADRQTLDFFWLHHNDQSGILDSDVFIQRQDEDEFDANLDWFGVRAEGHLNSTISAVSTTGVTLAG